MNNCDNRSASGSLARVIARSLAVSLILIASASCCKHGRIKPRLGPRPDLEPVRVLSCRAIAGATYCEIERDPLLRNDAALKDAILRLRTSSAWANPDPLPAHGNP